MWMYADKLSMISLSNNSIKRRNELSSEDTLRQVIESLKSAGRFFIQLDQYADIANKFPLMLFSMQGYNETIVDNSIDG